MDSTRIGLDYIVENPEYIGKLAGALDTANVIVKKQVFELLSALCVYNEQGYRRALETLDHYKVCIHKSYKLKLRIIFINSLSSLFLLLLRESYNLCYSSYA